MLELAITTLGYAAAHVMRGQNVLPRFLFFPLCGVILGVAKYMDSQSLADALISAVIGIVGWVLYLASGWGLGLKVITPELNQDINSLREKTRLTALYSSIADKLAGYSLATYDSPAKVRPWAFIWMTLRGAQLMPLFLSLGYFASWAFLMGFACWALHGAIYRLAGSIYEPKAVMIAEILMGMLVGMLTGLILVLS